MIDTKTLSLVTPTSNHQAALLAMLEAFEAAGERNFYPDRLQVQQNMEGYLQHLAEMERGIGLQAGLVPQTTFWLAREGTYFIGFSHLRHELTPTLEQHGGHIGYAIRPAERRQGYATLLLSWTLDQARKLGLERVLLTCDIDNLASVRVIEKNGGVLENQVVSTVSGNLISRYWIQL